MNVMANKEVAVRVNIVVGVKANKLVGRMRYNNEEIKEGKCFR